MPRRLPRHTEGFASLLAVDVVDHPLHNHRNHRLPPLGASQKLQLVSIIHEPALYESCSTPCTVEDVERRLFVGITVRIVRPKLPPRKIFFSRTIERRSEMVALRQPRASVAAPSGGVVPLAVGASGIDMHRNECDIPTPQLVAPPGTHRLR